MMIEEMFYSLRASLQEPEGSAFDHSDQSQIFGLLLVPQEDHAVVWSSICALRLLALPVEVVLGQVVLHRILRIHLVVICKGLTFVLGEPVPDVAPVLPRDAWGDRVVFDVHRPGQEHTDVLEFLVNLQPLVVWGDAAKDVALVDTDLLDLLDGRLVASQAHVSVEVDDANDVVEVRPGFFAFRVVVLRQLVHVKNLLVTVVRVLLLHFERVIQLSQDRVLIQELARAHRSLRSHKVDEGS